MWNVFWFFVKTVLFNNVNEIRLNTLKTFETIKPDFSKNFQN